MSSAEEITDVEKSYHAKLVNSQNFPRAPAILPFCSRVPRKWSRLIKVSTVGSVLDGGSAIFLWNFYEGDSLENNISIKC